VLELQHRDLNVTITQWIAPASPCSSCYSSPGHFAPINLGLPLHAPQPAPGNNPFLAPPAPAAVAYNGQQYNHLPAALSQQLSALPPVPAQENGCGCGRNCGHVNGEGHAPAPAAMVCDIMHLGISDTV